MPLPAQTTTGIHLAKVWVRADLEILTLAGTTGGNGTHIHMSIADSEGRVMGGHVAHGCIVRTTAELVLLLLLEWSFEREFDPAC